MFAPFGEDVKQAGPALREFRPLACSDCQTEAPVVHDQWVRSVPVGLQGVALGQAKVGVGDLLPPDVVEFQMRRYVCRACGGRTTVVPDCLLPRAVYPAEVREWAMVE